MSDSPAGDLEFAKLVAGDPKVDLAEVLLDFAGDAYPNLDRSTCRAELDRLGLAARARLAAVEPGPQLLRRRLVAVSQLLYVDEGFRGNEREYYDPRNSYLNEVLARRAGIPITLGVVYLSVAERAGLAMHGVPTPGHFVLGAQADGENWFVDPFTAGDVLPLEACRHRIERMTGQEGALSPAHFRPATPQEIAARVLRNLKAAYVMADHWLEALPVQERLVRLLPDSPDEKRDLGLLYLRLGRPLPALALLEPYAQQCPPEQAEQLAPYLRSARRMRAELN